MGWAANDATTREQLKVQVSLARAELYKVAQLISKIEHEEKREALRSGHARAEHGLEWVAFTLDR